MERPNKHDSIFSLYRALGQVTKTDDGQISPQKVKWLTKDNPDKEKAFWEGYNEGSKIETNRVKH